MGPKRKSIAQTTASRKKSKKVPEAPTPVKDVVAEKPADQEKIESDPPNERDIIGFEILVSIDFIKKLGNNNDELKNEFSSEYGLKLATNGDIEKAFGAVVKIDGVSTKIYAFLTHLLDKYVASDDSIQILLDADALLEMELWMNPALAHCILSVPKSTAKIIAVNKANCASIKNILNKWPEKYGGTSVDGYSSVFVGNYGDPETFKQPQLVNQQMMKVLERQNQMGSTAFEKAPNPDAEEAEAGLPPNGVANITTKQGFYQAKNQLALQSKSRQGGNQLTLKVTVPQEFVGGLIGKGGTRISEMRNLSGASLRVDMPADGIPETNSLRQVAIHGQSDQVNMALTLLVKRLEAEMQNKSRKYAA